MKTRSCLFVEVEPGQTERVRSLFRDCGPLALSAEVLHDTPIEHPEEVETLSTFIHSRVDDRALERLPGLRLVTSRSTGLDHIDLAACRARGVMVCHVPSYGANTVAEHTFALLLSLTRQVHKAYEQTVRGRFDLDGLQGIDLRDRTLGVIGTGYIGAHVIRIALGFQMRVLAFDTHPAHAMADALGFRYVELPDLLASSDVVSLHAPYTPETHHLIDQEAIARMKPGAILINTARGGLVDTEALVDGLHSGHLGGAGLDVLENEQAILEEGQILTQHYDEKVLLGLLQSHALLKLDNVIVTPHIAFHSAEALDKILNTTLENIRAFRAGRPQNVAQ